MKYTTEEQHYLDGIKRLESKGILVYIDGQRAEEKDWGKIFQVREDGAFYMCDYVGTEDGILKEKNTPEELISKYNLRHYIMYN